MRSFLPLSSSFASVLLASAVASLVGCAAEMNATSMPPSSALVAPAPPAAPTPPTPPTAAPAPPAPPVSGGPVDVAGPGSVPVVAPPATNAGGGADFRACTTADDCVAVPKVGCCHNGANEAVNKLSADAYQKSFTCKEKRPMCPQYIRKDERKATCDMTSHKCAMQD